MPPGPGTGTVALHIIITYYITITAVHVVQVVLVLLHDLVVVYI